MAGTIAADTLTHSSAGSLTTDFVVNGSAKCWANFKGSGTLTTRDTFNVSSMTDDGTGNYDITFSNSMNNDDYALAGAAYARTVGMADNQFFTSYANIRVIDSGGSASDAGVITAMFMGDLA